MDLTVNLAPSYRDLKDPTTRQNFEDTPGQIPKLILTLRLTLLFHFACYDCAIFQHQFTLWIKKTLNLQKLDTF